MILPPLNHLGRPRDTMLTVHMAVTPRQVADAFLSLTIPEMAEVFEFIRDAHVMAPGYPHSFPANAEQIAAEMSQQGHEIVQALGDASRVVCEMEGV